MDGYAFIQEPLENTLPHHGLGGVMKMVVLQERSQIFSLPPVMARLLYEEDFLLLLHGLPRIYASFWKDFVSTTQRFCLTRETLRPCQWNLGKGF